MMTRLLAVGEKPGPVAYRRPLVIACATSAIVLIAACASSPSRAQQPPAARVVAKAGDDPGKDKAAEKEKEEALRAELTLMVKPMFHRMFLAELRFVRSATGASEEQTRGMARAARDPLRLAVAGCVEEQFQLLRRHDPGGEPNSGAAYLSVQKTLGSIAAAKLSPEQLARYRDQVQKRSEHRKQAAIRILLAALDQELRLAAAQCEKIGASLASHWDPKWDIAGEVFADFAEDRSFPELPDAVIVPFLTQRQKAAWEQLPKGAGDVTLVDILELDTPGDGPMAEELDPETAPAAAPKR